MVRHTQRDQENMVNENSPSRYSPREYLYIKTMYIIENTLKGLQGHILSKW